MTQLEEEKQIVLLNAGTMNFVTEEQNTTTKKTDVTIKRVHKPHSVSLVGEWNPGIYIHNKIWQTYGLCLYQRPQTLCAVEQMQAVLSVGP